ncbi:hypothetical protein ACFWPQ_47990 [Streptomyces sp. NPDC058464]|uniref:hypothetical protein n=1 Tax=Streptomyces sp. NPDC058464 TaxID=3346511 RepID=UPI00364818A9
MDATTRTPARPAAVSGAPDGQRALAALGAGFLESLTSHDPGKARLAPSFRATENLREVPVGAGLWETAEDFLGLLTFIDPAQSQLVHLGVAVAGGHRPFALRVKAEGGLLTEAETILGSDVKGHFADVDQLLKPDIIYGAPVPPDRASDRDGLLRVADSYWRGLQESDGSLVPVGYRCDRYDNGKKITNTLTTLLSPDAAVHTVASCLNATRGARPRVRGRRFPVLDVAHGVAVSLAVADFHPVPSSPRPDSGSFYVVAVFKVVDQEIRIIDEIREIMPLGTPCAWSGE